MPCQARNVDLAPCRNQPVGRGPYCGKHRRKRILWDDVPPGGLTWRLERNNDRTYSAIGADAAEVRIEYRFPYRRMCRVLGRDLIDEARMESRPLPLFAADVERIYAAVGRPLEADGPPWPGAPK